MPDFPLVVTKPIEYVDQEIFSGNSPIDWSDLDLSSWVGKRRVLAYIKCHAVGLTSDVRFREKGETEDTEYSGVQTVTGLYTNYSGYVWVYTDENGVVEWIATNSAQCVLTLMAYTLG